MGATTVLSTRKTYSFFRFLENTEKDALYVTSYMCFVN